VVDASADASILVIGEPACDTDYPRLPGARDEALAVEQCLAAALGADRITALISPDDAGQVGANAQTIIGALLGRDWRIVHVAGHGAPPEKIGPAPKKAGDPPQQDGDPRGVVLSDGAFLGPREVRSMRRVPELVFVNCCHLGARNEAQLLTQDGTDNVALPDRPRFAAGVAEELIKIGVRCVIAAGWAVDDGAAGAFATPFTMRWRAAASSTPSPRRVRMRGKWAATPGGLSVLRRSRLAFRRRGGRCAATLHVIHGRVRRHGVLEESGAGTRVARGQEQVPECAGR
jgi:hypothetical protein